MDVFEIDGVSYTPWKRPEHSEGMKPHDTKPGKPHEIEEVLSRSGLLSKELDMKTGSIPAWKRSFLDVPMHKLAPLVARVNEAIARAKAVSQDFKPEARLRHQEAELVQSFKQLGEAVAEAIEQHAKDWERVEALSVQLPEPPKDGNAGVIYHLQATEVRTILRTMEPEAREIYVRNQVKLGNLMPLQACVSAPDAILSRAVLGKSAGTVSALNIPESTNGGRT